MKKDIFDKQLSSWGIENEERAGITRRLSTFFQVLIEIDKKNRKINKVINYINNIEAP